MKTVLTAIFGLVFSFATLAGSNAINNTRTYSHLPLDVKEFLCHELSTSTNISVEPFSGCVYLGFYIDGNQKMVVTELSSTNLLLGEYVKNELSNLPKLSADCKTGRSYYIKIRMCCN